MIKRRSQEGLLRYGIPSFKLPREVLKKELENIFNMGIEFQGWKSLGKRFFTLKDLKESGYNAVFIAIGARKERFFGFQGEELAESGFEFLYKFNKGLIDLNEYKGKKIAILGCSYTAVELSRVLRRLGCAVTVYYPRSKNGSACAYQKGEIGYAEKKRKVYVKFVYVTAPWILRRSSILVTG